MHAAVTCPALFISAAASGQGKTTVTAALAHLHRQAGRRVRVFKTGPDYLDPMILQAASGAPVYQLDLWMGGAAHCRQLLYRAATDADLILVEGAMGLFDGTPSSADLAMTFGLPVLAVIDASAMAQTFGAVAHGLGSYRPELAFAGVIANRVAGAAHGQMLGEGLRPGVRYVGALARDDEWRLPDRHLGLVQAPEIADLDARLARAAAAVACTDLAHLPAPVRFTAETIAPPAPDLRGTRIGVARDAAFAFLYPANLDLLRSLGAVLSFFSPLADATLPAVDSLYLPGGYPELHLSALSANHSMRAAIAAHHAAGKPMVAECGGMLYLMESLTHLDGQRASLAGVLPGHARMQRGLSNLGLQSVTLPEGELRGHTYHHSVTESPMTPLTLSQDARPHGRGEAVYRVGRLHASYLHLYFPSNPTATARLFRP
jgi:cobyrinic acid a,c-diamide synthase